MGLVQKGSRIFYVLKVDEGASIFLFIRIIAVALLLLYFSSWLEFLYFEKKKIQKICHIFLNFIVT